ncbi:hypothetical protein QWY28_21465 [Nocardioides sp. SOB77]|uniref:Uncharacterized protein n=1 Tax=Nocardioides oceani TaxID=3058369 RepID=A0ABT8FMC6_9ACTN|nr:hypothetical protein [Nocardioides oceani]MDN4175547.1 hypothetical protein [Nocardioides oceani]
MPAYLAWTAAPPVDLEGPWTEARSAGPGLFLIDSTEHLSAVYHALKWSLPDDTALVVVPLHETPKLRGLAPGTTTWLRERTVRPDRT